MSKTAYQKTLLTGGSGSALDGIDGAGLLDGDFAYVMASNVMYVYILDDDSGAAEASPNVIAPDTNPGNKRWLLQSINAGSGTIAVDHIGESTAAHGVSIDSVLLKDGDVTGTIGAATASTGAFTTATLSTAITDNTATTQAASTAYAKSQDAVLAREPDQGVAMTAAAIETMKVLDSDHIDFGTGNFTLCWKGAIPNWQAGTAIYLFHKQVSLPGFYLSITSLNLLALALNNTLYTVAAANTFVAGTAHEIVAVVSVGATNTTVSFYTDGVFIEDVVHANETTISGTSVAYLLGYASAIQSGTVHHAYTFNRALTAAEVLDLYRNGIANADKWGSQTEQTSGTLTIGKKYRINNWITDDDFTNIGGANVDGTEFTATGTTPTKWTNSSTVVQIGATLALESEGIMGDQWYGSANSLNATYPSSGSSLTRPWSYANLQAAANNAAAAGLTVPVPIGGLYRTNADPSVICVRTA